MNTIKLIGHGVLT